MTWEICSNAENCHAEVGVPQGRGGAFTLVVSIILRSNMPGGRAIYSLQLTYYSISCVINWNVSSVGLSILFVRVCSTPLGGLALKPHACSGVM